MFSCLFVVFFGFTISLIPGNGLLDRRGDQPPVAHGSRDDDLLPVERHEIGVVGERAGVAFLFDLREGAAPSRQSFTTLMSSSRTRKA